MLEPTYEEVNTNISKRSWEESFNATVNSLIEDLLLPYRFSKFRRGYENTGLGGEDGFLSLLKDQYGNDIFNDASFQLPEYTIRGTDDKSHLLVTVLKTNYVDISYEDWKNAINAYTYYLSGLFKTYPTQAKDSATLVLNTIRSLTVLLETLPEYVKNGQDEYVLTTRKIKMDNASMFMGGNKIVDLYKYRVIPSGDSKWFVVEVPIRLKDFLTQSSKLKNVEGIFRNEFKVVSVYASNSRHFVCAVRKWGLEYNNRSDFVVYDDQRLDDGELNGEQWKVQQYYDHGNAENEHMHGCYILLVQNDLVHNPQFEPWKLSANKNNRCAVPACITFFSMLPDTTIKKIKTKVEISGNKTRKSLRLITTLLNFYFDPIGFDDNARNKALDEIMRDWTPPGEEWTRFKPEDACVQHFFKELTDVDFFTIFSERDPANDTRSKPDKDELGTILHGNNFEDGNFIMVDLLKNDCPPDKDCGTGLNLILTPRYILPGAYSA